MCLKTRLFCVFTGSSCLQRGDRCSQCNDIDLRGCGLGLVALSQPAGSAIVTLTSIRNVAWHLSEGVTEAPRRHHGGLPSALQLTPFARRSARVSHAPDPKSASAADGEANDGGGASNCAFEELNYKEWNCGTHLDVVVCMCVWTSECLPLVTSY